VGVTSASLVSDVLDAIIVSLGVPEVVSGARLIDPVDLEMLLAIERSAVSAAVPARRAEFASGRALLRSLIGHDVAVPMAADRRPLLPTGVRASLAHDGQYVVAVSSRSDDIASLGIDIEPDRMLEPGMVSVIARPDESEIDPLVLFCAKEAAYKAWSQSGGGFLEHTDVRVRLDGATFTAEVLEHGVVLDGGWARVDGRCVTVAVLRPGCATDRTPSSRAAGAPTQDQVSGVECR
jgi:4'-phosphopantetheinyl transferase EntD